MKVLITRPRDQAPELARLLEAAGLEVVAFPTIEILPPEDWAPLDRAIANLERYHWIIFTSANGVKAFLERWDKVRGGALPPLHVAAIGPGTAKALYQRGIEVDLVPGNFRAEELAKELIRKGVQGKRLFLPRARVARDVLPRMLREAGAEVDVVEAYRAERPEDGDRLRASLEGVEMVVFTSSQTVKNFVDILEGDWPQGLRAAAIGPITAQTLEGLGIKPEVLPEEYTVEALARAVIEHLRRR